MIVKKSVTLTVLELERRKRGLTQQELGTKSGVDPSYICRAEKYSAAYPGHLSRIAKALDWKGNPELLLAAVV